MIRRTLWILALALLTSPAHAQLCLSVGACPDNSGATGNAPVDCAGVGGSLTVLGTWAPEENVPALASVIGRLQLVVAGDLGSDAAFWLFDPAYAGEAGANALTVSPLRPATGCNAPAYLDVWNASGSSALVAAVETSPSIEVIAFNCSRPTSIAVTQGQRVFVVQLLIDLSRSAEGNGGEAGCSRPVCLAWDSLRLFDANGAETYGGSSGYSSSPFGASQGISPRLGLNGGGNLCAAVPTRPATWGRLKSLYR